MAPNYVMSAFIVPVASTTATVAAIAFATGNLHPKAGFVVILFFMSIDLIK